MFAKKHFGQHFLHDQSIIDAIIHSIAVEADDKLIEIGPGHGALTAPLVRACRYVTAVEIDRTLIKQLTERFGARATIVHGDIRTTDIRTLVPNSSVRICGNLPYNIAASLIVQLFTDNNHISDMTFMVQREVAERMTASAGSSNYGKLSVITALYTHATMLFSVPPDAFVPKPKVDSAVVRFLPKKFPEGFDANETSDFLAFVGRCFAHRRKTLRNNLKPIAIDTLLSQCGLPHDIRAQGCTLDDFLQLHRLIRHTPA